MNPSAASATGESRCSAPAPAGPTNRARSSSRRTAHTATAPEDDPRLQARGERAAASPRSRANASAAAPVSDERDVGVREAQPRAVRSSTLAHGPGLAEPAGRRRRACRPRAPVRRRGRLAPAPPGCHPRSRRRRPRSRPGCGSAPRGRPPCAPRRAPRCAPGARRSRSAPRRREPGAAPRAGRRGRSQRPRRRPPPPAARRGPGGAAALRFAGARDPHPPALRARRRDRPGRGRARRAARGRGRRRAGLVTAHHRRRDRQRGVRPRRRRRPAAPARGARAGARPGRPPRRGQLRRPPEGALVGTSALVPVEGGRLTLGRWQRVFFCEFDGPRQRELHVRRVAG